MSLKHGLLGFLTEREMSGYDLEKRFKSSVGHFWSAKISQVYRDLHTMEKAGWVESHEIIQKNKPNKKIFKITEAGYEELKDWLSNYTIKNDFEIRSGILMRLFFSTKIPVEETIRLLEQFRDACMNELNHLRQIPEIEGLTKLEQSYPMDIFYVKTTVAYGEKYYQMQLDWCNETFDKLNALKAKKEAANHENGHI